MPDPYEILRRKLNLYPIGMPESPTALEILKTLYAPEEARVMAVLHPLPLFQDATEVAFHAELPLDQAKKTLLSLSERGLVIELHILGKLRYILMPIYPGLFELAFMTPVPHPRKEELARLWEKYHREELAPEVYRQKTPAMRVIPVRRSLPVSHTVHRFEDAAAILSNARSLAIGPCACRTAFHHCDRPTDTCIILNIYADYLVERRFARRATRDDALRTLERAEEHGLVHCSANSRMAPAVVCSCCPCCCGFLRGIAHYNKAGVVSSSNFLPRLDAAACVACGECAAVCPSGAAAVSETHPRFDPSLCIGCGLCARHCAHGAVTMRRRPDTTVPPKDTPALISKMILGKVAKKLTEPI